MSKTCNLAPRDRPSQESSKNLKKYFPPLPSAGATHILCPPSNALELLSVHVMGIDLAGSDALVVRR
jgi:hypothetical protein